MGFPARNRLLPSLLALCLGAPAAAAWTQARGQARVWIFSGSELIEALEGKRENGARDGEFRRAISAARANARIAGVAEATSGTRWCGAGTVPPHELADRVYAYHRCLAPGRLKESAATLVSEAPARTFPCPRR